MERKIAVSVIIPTYNRKHTLKRCIDSVLKQTYQDYEIVIVDDCSTDGSLEYISELYGELENLTYIRNDHNMGPGAARNVGVLHAKGEFVAFHDSDDEWMPKKLEKQMEAILKADDDVGLVYSSFCGKAEDGRIGVWSPKDWTMDKKEGDIFPWLLLQPVVGAITILMRKEIFLAVGGFNEALKALEDYEFTLRVAEKYKFIFIEEALAMVHDTVDSVGKSIQNSLDAQCYILEQYQAEYERYGLKEDKFLRLLEDAKLHGNVGEFLKTIVLKLPDADYIGYVKNAIRE